MSGKISLLREGQLAEIFTAHDLVYNEELAVRVHGPEGVKRLRVQESAPGTARESRIPYPVRIALGTACQDHKLRAWNLLGWTCRQACLQNEQPAQELNGRVYRFEPRIDLFEVELREEGGRVITVVMTRKELTSGDWDVVSVTERSPAE